MPLESLHREVASDLKREHSKIGWTIQILCTLHQVVVGKETTKPYLIQWNSFFMFINSCFSYLGMIGRRQAVNIGRGCEFRGIVQHEILHALGRAHEQSRPDRDNYVIINMNNIRQGNKKFSCD